MKKFILRILFFFFVLFLFFILGLILPATPQATKSILFSKIAKDSLLKNVPSPRIIFIGGSNLNMGLNSQLIKDSLGLNPINTSITVNIGLIYMMDDMLKYIKKGDVVIAAPEYAQYYNKDAYGGEPLLRIIFDVPPFSMNEIRKEQWANIYIYLIKYSYSKFIPMEYLNKKEYGNYTVNSFNKYGDTFTHWKLKKINFLPFNSIEGNFNHSIIIELLKFKKKLQEKGAILYVTFPGYQAASFENSRTQIMRVEAELNKKDFFLLGKPNRYKFPDSLMFDTPYHLSKEGLDLRTQMLIEDLKKFSK